MRSLFFRTLLFLPLVLLLLNCTASTQPSADSDQLQIEINLSTNQAGELEDSQEVIAPNHLILAEQYVGTTELTGNNDGLEIEQFLESVGLAKGNPYCAAFVSYILEESQGVIEPEIRSGLASKFITSQSIDAREVLRGTVAVPDGTILIWRKGNTLYGHAGFVAEQLESNLFSTIEANTSSGVYGSQRDGDGVWNRERSIQPGNYFRITNFTMVNYG